MFLGDTKALNLGKDLASRGGSMKRGAGAGPR